MNKTSQKILFILKKRGIYTDDRYTTVNSGLHNSAVFVNNMLNKSGVESNIVQVVDNNEINKFVTEYKPDTVIIEALWVVPSKFKILNELHPNVNWLIRVHSEIPFIANEGIAMSWLKEYVKYDNVFISANSKDFANSMEAILKTDIQFLPNYYPRKIYKHSCIKDDNTVDIGLFGAIRPMKNSLTQAVAAITYANKANRRLRLHINIERVEQKGDNTLKNIRALFVNSVHELVEHKWYDHKEFLEVVASMDLGLQVSLTETYNIVTADFVSQGIPVVTSEEIEFVNPFNTVDTNKNSLKIARKIKIALRYRRFFVFYNKILLKIDSIKSKFVWLNNKFIK